MFVGAWGVLTVNLGIWLSSYIYYMNDIATVGI